MKASRADATPIMHRNSGGPCADAEPEPNRETLPADGDFIVGQRMMHAAVSYHTMSNRQPADGAHVPPPAQLQILTFKFAYHAPCHVATLAGGVR